MLLIAAHEPDPRRPAGVCYIETKSLDGETNLKGRAVPQVLAKACGGTIEEQTKALERLSGFIECEQPNPTTRKFNGTLQLKASGADAEEKITLSINNVLLRGSVVRNSQYVIGMVINTGVDTKVMQGARKPPLKRSSLDMTINVMMLVIFAGQVLICFIATVVLYRLGEQDHIEDAWYLLNDEGQHTEINVIITYFRFFVLLANFVSVSLYASVDVKKFLYAKRIEDDKRMWHADSGVKCKVRTASLIDEVGTISHVFSDKTGTLTQNVMQFRKCSINGVAYGRGTTEIGRARLARLGISQPEGNESTTTSASDSSSNMSPVNFDGPELEAALKGTAGDAQKAACVDFFLLLALCHTVVVEEINGQKRLSASSPDEAALVAAAKHFGMEFVSKQHGKVTVLDRLSSVRQVERTFEVLDVRAHAYASSPAPTLSLLSPSALPPCQLALPRALSHGAAGLHIPRPPRPSQVLEFTSARKRMSIIVSDPATGEVRLLSKGADNIMMQLLDKQAPELRAKTDKDMEAHANDGLRTLVVAHKTLDRSAYSSWSARYQASLTQISELEKKEREEPNLIDSLMGEMEQGLTLLGSTAIEDKLQAGVPAAIADLNRAGISCWVLTGDKEETAINIAHACELFDTKTTLHTFNSKSCSTAAQVAASMTKYAQEAEAEALRSGGSRRGIVIDGEVISMVFSSADTQLALLNLARRCHSLVACRCAPSQKAQLVLLVKNNVKGATTLAIGDGANDVAMIQAADVGVGISGEEGMQAANSADFSFGQFRFLLDLLLCHGRNEYRRMSTLVYYVFYKAFLLTCILFWYLPYNASTGQKFYLEAAYQTYNFVYAGVPILVYAFNDFDVVDSVARQVPQLYHLGVRRVYSGYGLAGRWALVGIAESLVIFFFTVAALDNTTRSGETAGVWQIGDYCFAQVMMVVTGKLCLLSYQMSRWQHGILFVNLLLWWPLDWIGGLDATQLNAWTAPLAEGYLGMFWQVQSTASFWLTLLLVPITVLLPQYAWVTYRRLFTPILRDLVMEAEWHQNSAAKEAIMQYEIPAADREMRLHKNAPRPIEPPSLMDRLRGRGRVAA